MRIVILAVGRLREEGLKKSADEFLRRLSRYCQIEVSEIEDENDPGPAAEALGKLAMDREAGRILARIKPQDHVVALERRGEQLDSVLFSDRIREWKTRAMSPVFVIGGSLGLGERVLDRADEKLSLSDMTFPHQLARVMLLEQVYRSFKIISGERYHK